MSERTAKSRTIVFWSVPALGLAIGVVYFATAAASGRPALGAAMFGIMAAFSLAVVLASRRSETVRGLLDRRDERITGIDLHATAFAGIAVIVALLVGFLVELAKGHSTAPYDWLGAVAGLAYVAAVVVLRMRR